MVASLMFAVLGVLVQNEGILADPKFGEALKAFIAAPTDPATRAKVDALIAAYPNDPMGWLAVGQALFARRDYKRAGEFLSKAVERFPRDTKVLYAAGLVWFALEKYDQSEALLRKALEADPNDALVVYNLAQALGGQRKIDEAERLFQKAAAMAPDRSLFHFSLGEALMHVGKSEEAIAAFTKAAELGKVHRRPEDVPSRGRALHNLGRMLGMEGKDAEAKAAFEASIREIPNDAEAHAQYGVYLYRQKKYADAIALLSKAVELGPRHRQANLHLGLCLKQLGRNDEAEMYMKRFRDLQADFEKGERDSILERMQENLKELGQPKKPGDAGGR